MLDLEPIKEREQAATPGPWYPMFGGEPDLISAVIGSPWNLAQFFSPSQDGRNPDADFTAHAREDIPALIAEVERQEVLLKRAMAIIADAIMHGMPITEEVAAVRNEIVCGPGERIFLCHTCGEPALPNKPWCEMHIQ